MEFVEFQYYPKWSLHYSKTLEEYHIYTYYQHTLCIGPFQFRWKS